MARPQDSEITPVERLRSSGLRATAPRLAILGALRRERWHPTAEDVHSALRRTYPSLSLSTVYLTLEAFLRADLCRKVPSSDGRLRVDGAPRPHHHAVCIGCGSIHDVDGELFPLPPLPRVLPKGLLVRGARVEVDVLCPSCRKTALPPSRRPEAVSEE